MAVESGDGPSEHINLKVLGQDNAVVQFKIKMNTPLKNLMNAYCERTVCHILLVLLYTSVLSTLHK